MTVSMETNPIVYSNVNFNNTSTDISDLAFVMALYQLEIYDADLQNCVASLQITSELKKAYNERLQKLRDWISKADSDDKKIGIPANELYKVDYEWSAEQSGIVERKGEKFSGCSSDYYLVDSEGNRIKEKLSFEISPVSDRDVFRHDSLNDATTIQLWSVEFPIEGSENYVREKAEKYPGCTVMVKVSRTELENEINRIQTKLDELGSDGEFQLLTINRALGRRNQVLQLASNIMSSTHQSAMGIIQNIK